MRTYEELTGADGKNIFFRAERFRPSDIFSSHQPKVVLGGEVAVLKNLSMTGLAVQCAEDSSWQDKLDTEIPIKFLVGSDEIYAGAGKVRRSEMTGLRTTVAIELTTGYLDFAEIQKQHEYSVLRQTLDDPFFGEAHDVLPEFKTLSGEIINLFRSYKDVLEKFESNLALEGSEREAVLLEALKICEDRIVPQWKELWYRGSDILWPIMKDPEKVAAHKAYTERVLTPEFMGGPVMRRCYEKPLGYPGDYQIMNYVYKWERIGNSLYEKLLHRIGLVTGECVGTRLRMAQAFLREHIEQSAATAGDEVLNITNLGCGSAYEVADYLKIEELPRSVQFTLIDQDHDALSYAYNHAHREVIRHGGKARVRCLQASFAELLKAGKLFNTMKPQDIIYSLGLYDYLSAKRAKALTHDLYEQVKPGGYLILANVKTGREACMWPLEFVTDWSLVYRTEQDMWDMVDGLDCERISMEEDSTKCVWVMVVRKPA